MQIFFKLIYKHYHMYQMSRSRYERGKRKVLRCCLKTESDDVEMLLDGSWSCALVVVECLQKAHQVQVVFVIKSKKCSGVECKRSCGFNGHLHSAIASTAQSFLLCSSDMLPFDPFFVFTHNFDNTFLSNFHILGRTLYWKDIHILQQSGSFLIWNML